MARTQEHKTALSKAIQAGYDNGRIAPMQDQTHSDASKRLMSQRIKQGYADGRVHNLKGKQHTNETKLKMCKPKKRVTCAYCLKEGASNAMNRFHKICPVSGLTRVDL